MSSFQEAKFNMHYNCICKKMFGDFWLVKLTIDQEVTVFYHSTTGLCLQLVSLLDKPYTMLVLVTNYYWYSTSHKLEQI